MASWDPVDVVHVFASGAIENLCFDRRLACAIVDDDVELVLQMLEQTSRTRYCLNALGREGYNVLHFASRRGIVEIVAALLDRGADINAPDEFGATPLVSAIACYRDGVARLLIERGADVNPPRTSIPPLLQAARFSDELVTAILRAKVDVNQRDMHDATALHWAVRDGAALRANMPWWRIISTLVESRADVNAVDMCGLSPLARALLTPHAPSAELLVSLGADLSPLKVRLEHLSGRAAVVVVVVLLTYEIYNV